MTVRELDRLVSKIEITPATKRALREVRQAVISGEVTTEVNGGRWTVAFDTSSGMPIRMSFSLIRDKK